MCFFFFLNLAFGEPISIFLARVLFCVTFVLVNWDFLKDSGQDIWNPLAVLPLTAQTSPWILKLFSSLHRLFYIPTPNNLNLSLWFVQYLPIDHLSSSILHTLSEWFSKTLNLIRLLCGLNPILMISPLLLVAIMLFLRVRPSCWEGWGWDCGVVRLEGCPWVPSVSFPSIPSWKKFSFTFIKAGVQRVCAIGLASAASVPVWVALFLAEMHCCAAVPRFPLGARV